MQVGVRLVFFRYFFAGFPDGFLFNAGVRIGSFGNGFGLAWIFFQIRVTQEGNQTNQTIPHLMSSYDLVDQASIQ